MGFRFRKSINIIPGVRLNLSNGSPSLNIGPRGASVSFGSRGTFANLGLPGTGLSYRTRLDHAARSRGGNRTASNPALRQSLEQQAAELMSAVTAIRNIHELTPDPRTGVSWSELEIAYLQSRMVPFNVPAPERPEKPEYLLLPEQPGDSDGVSFLGKWFESESAKSERHAENLQRWQQEVADIERENMLRQHRYLQQRTTWAEQYAHWKFDAEKHEARLATAESDAQHQFCTDTAFFESYLAGVLTETEWPRETLVTFEVKPEQSTVLLDVDLAEIEDMPDKIFSMNARGTELTEKSMTQKTQRENYARHIHGCLFRLAGIILHTLPFENVIISGFTQRISKRTGYLEDEYILSCKCSRRQMASINFAGIEEVDPVEALGDHLIIRKMSSTFIFQPIEPLTLKTG
ncbi:DUF4236 domain-containing protein [Pseudescherichia sp.]|uniref:DUF4236 domain-containing protein n=1 Tax=Pseudescherichia sp. TaxID=2055881 RepID=UPI0028A15C65|nr:DUF4236 domain-containing protein [Pseudescherichia sp.]